MEEELQQLRTNASGDLMSDEDFIKTIESMGIEAQEREINDLLKAMHENRIVSWDEAERILQETDKTPIKCSLPEQTRPTEPDNEVDVDMCIRKLLDNDPSLKEVNLNNMKRTPVPAIKRLLEALAYNEHCERISLANMGLYDHDVMVLVTVIEMNQAIKKVNLETNYLSGDFFAKLFKAALNNETVEEIKAVNQGVSFSTQSEKEIIDAIVKNRGLTKISINFRLPEGRHKVENATLRNGELKRIKRREAALKAKQEAEELAKNPVPKLAPEPPKKDTVAPPKKETPKIPPALPKSLVSPEPKPCTTKVAPIVATAKPKASILARQLSWQRASRESEEDTELVKSPPPLPETPKKLAIPKTFKKEEQSEKRPELQKVERRPTRQWVPKKIIDDEETEEKSKEDPAGISAEPKKPWKPKITPNKVVDDYAPVLNVSGAPTGVPRMENSKEIPHPPVKRAPVSAKNIWEQRIAKMEKKEKKDKPLLSIHKIREMEKKKEVEDSADKLDQLLKKDPKKLNDEHRKAFENNNAIEEKKERKHTQKIIAKKPNSLVDLQKIEMEKTQEEKRPATVIRRTVMRKKDEVTTQEMSAPKKRVVRKKKATVIDGDEHPSTNSILRQGPTPTAVH